MLFLVNLSRKLLVILTSLFELLSRSGKSGVNLREEHRIFEYRLLRRRIETKREDEMEAGGRGE